MTIPNESSMDALREMLAERSRYEGWLAQLEAKRANTPLHVLERVKTDYQSRLDHVTVQLRGRAVELEATVSGLRNRVAALAGEEEQRRDERAEAQLRASVGELSGDEARQTIAACDAAINSMVAQRDAVGSELAKLQEVLHLVVSAPARQERPGADELVSVDALAPTGDQAAVHAASAVDTQELEFLRSVVSPADEGNAPAQGVGGQLLDGPATEMLPPPTLAAPRRPITPLGNVPMRDPLRAVAGDGSLTPGNMPSFLKDMPSEQVKTLKCQECGTMNYPTEWYCEKCGGELAAM